MAEELEGIAGLLAQVPADQREEYVEGLTQPVADYHKQRQNSNAQPDQVTGGDEQVLMAHPVNVIAAGLQKDAGIEILDTDPEAKALLDERDPYEFVRKMTAAITAKQKRLAGGKDKSNGKPAEYVPGTGGKMIGEHFAEKRAQETAKMPNTLSKNPINEYFRDAPIEKGKPKMTTEIDILKAQLQLITDEAQYQNLESEIAALERQEKLKANQAAKAAREAAAAAKQAAQAQINDLAKQLQANTGELERLDLTTFQAIQAMLAAADVYDSLDRSNDQLFKQASDLARQHGLEAPVKPRSTPFNVNAWNTGGAAKSLQKWFERAHVQVSQLERKNRGGEFSLSFLTSHNERIG